MLEAIIVYKWLLFDIWWCIIARQKKVPTDRANDIRHDNERHKNNQNQLKNNNQKVYFMFVIVVFLKDNRYFTRWIKTPAVRQRWTDNFFLCLIWYFDHDKILSLWIALWVKKKNGFKNFSFSVHTLYYFYLFKKEIFKRSELKK